MRRKQWLYGLALAALLLSPERFSWAEDGSTLQPESEAPTPQSLFSPLPSFGDANFLSRWGGSLSEHEKIRYLLDRVSQSNDRFIRNGLDHDGKKARAWLLYKMHHWVSGEVKTPDAFIERVAAFSQKTKKPYFVQLSDGKIYPLKSILRNELSAFRDYQSHLPSFRVENTSNQDSQVSILPHRAPPPQTAKA